MSAPFFRFPLARSLSSQRLILLAAFLLAVSPAQAFVTVINPSFEDNQLASDTDTYTAPYGSLNVQTGIPGWTFNASTGSSYSGIVTENGGTLGSPKDIPQGWQAAFIQGTGQLSQVLTFANAGSYLVRFRAAGRSNGGAGAETVTLTLDGNTLGSFTPAVGAWALYSTQAFTVALAGAHTLSFTGTVPYTTSDRTSFIDAVQVLNPAEATTAPPTSPVYDIVFIGDSITAGATLANSTTQASSVRCAQSLGQRFNAAIRMSNQGHSGHTTVDWLPSTNSTSDFQEAITAAGSLETSQPGQLIFSIMLGTNDSAQSGPNGSPVSDSSYLSNLTAIVNQLLVDYPGAYVFVHYPTYYTPNTENSSVYLAAGLARLQTYFPYIDQLITNFATTHPGHVFPGDKLAFTYFSNNYSTELTPESGGDGTFYLHPNLAGAIMLGAYWANAITATLNLSPNDSFDAWLQSVDLIPGAPGSGFNDTPANRSLPNGLAYAVPNGLSTAAAANAFNVTADIRSDTSLTTTLESSLDLITWQVISWSTAPSQTGVATGFTRDTVSDPIDPSVKAKFYRLQITH